MTMHRRVRKNHTLLPTDLAYSHAEMTGTQGSTAEFAHLAARWFEHHRTTWPTSQRSAYRAVAYQVIARVWQANWNGTVRRTALAWTEPIRPAHDIVETYAVSGHYGPRRDRDAGTNVRRHL
jgi:hypothetical protein